MYKIIIILLLICPAVVFADCIKDGSCIKNPDSTMTCTCSDPVITNVEISNIVAQINELQARIDSNLTAINNNNADLITNQNKLFDLQRQIEVAKKIGINVKG